MPRRLLVPQDDICVPGLILHDDLVLILHSYQLYAVERWIVDRNALLRFLVVYTGDPTHAVHLHVYDNDDEDLWLIALDKLAAHSGAKPKQINEGVVLLTSLAHFRSDIVLVPDGLFTTSVRTLLYTNINLLRLGSSGRTALTLSDPTESTTVRFLSTFHTDPGNVLALVSLIQSALAIFGYPLPTDGLLCNATLRAIAHWSRAYGSHSDRSVDPAFIAVLLSLILSTRNKLALLGFSHLLPQDPFVHPRTSLSPALAAYSHHSHSPAFIPLDSRLINAISSSFDSKRLSRVVVRPKHSTDSLLAPISDLPSFISFVSSSIPSLSLLWSLSSPTLRKRQKHRHPSHRAIASDGDKDNNRSTEEETDPVHRFAGSFHWPSPRVNLSSWAALTKRKHQSVDLTPSTSQLERPLPKIPQINTHPPRHHSSRRSTLPAFYASRAQSPTLQTSFFGEGDDEDLLSSGQVSPLSDMHTRPNPFYFSLGAGTGAGAHPNPNPSSTSIRTPISETRKGEDVIDEKMLTRLLLDKRNGDETSGSGHGTLGGGSGRIASWAGPVSGVAWIDSGEELEREEKKKKKRKSGFVSAGLVPPKDWREDRTRFHTLVRVVDEDGRLVEEEMDDEEEEEEGEEEGSEYGSEGHSEEEEESRRRAARGVAKGDLKRRRSFHDLDTFKSLDVLSPSRLKIDVELCGQCLIMWRREKHLRNVVECVRVLTATLSQSNGLLQRHYQNHLPSLNGLMSSSYVTPNYTGVYSASTPNVIESCGTSRSASPALSGSSPPRISSSPPQATTHRHSTPELLQSIDEASYRAERLSQGTNTMLYESEQFDVGGLWSWVGRERRKVWVRRGEVFGEGRGTGTTTTTTTTSGSGWQGRKLREGVHGAHGEFNRLQWRLDGRGVVVDELGRTESEAEEEERVERGMMSLVPESEREEVEFLDQHIGIKPMWLLRFFTSWGARWSAAVGATSTPVVVEPKVEDIDG